MVCRGPQVMKRIWLSAICRPSILLEPRKVLLEKISSPACQVYKDKVRAGSGSSEEGKWPGSEDDRGAIIGAAWGEGTRAPKTAKQHLHN